MAKRLNTVEMQNRKKSETIEWDDLILKAAKGQYGRRTRIVPTLAGKHEKDSFMAALFNDAKSVNPQDPVEVSKNTVDVNEKIYSNTDGEEDSTTVKIINAVENTEGHNYQQSVTKGIQWGANANVGLQFGLPQVGMGIGGGAGLNFQRQRSTMFVNEKKKENTAKLESHHEETVKIPPGKKATVRMTSYRVRYKLDYTMEYKISKSAFMRIKVDTCGLGLPLCTRMVYITAPQLLQYLPGYREDDECVYFRQDGELRWIADRMEVKKIITNL